MARRLRGPGRPGLYVLMPRCDQVRGLGQHLLLSSSATRTQVALIYYSSEQFRFRRSSKKRNMHPSRGSQSGSRRHPTRTNRWTSIYERIVVTGTIRSSFHRGHHSRNLHPIATVSLLPFVARKSCIQQIIRSHARPPSALPPLLSTSQPPRPITSSSTPSSTIIDTDQTPKR